MVHKETAWRTKPVDGDGWYTRRLPGVPNQWTEMFGTQEGHLRYQMGLDGKSVHEK